MDVSAKKLQILRTHFNLIGRSLQSAQFEGGPPKISVTEFSNQPNFEYMVTGSPSVMGLTNGHECIFAECNDITVKLTFGPV